MDIVKKLFELQDPVFKEFNVKLIPNVSRAKVIGVKTPALKALAKQLIESGESEKFLAQLPHEYFEENQLHAFILCEMKNFCLACYEVERFLPYVDNWSTCDQLIVKGFAKYPHLLVDKILEWLCSKQTYKVRFAIGLLMRYFLGERFSKMFLNLVAEIETEDYYINMMSAWFFATALVKQFDATLPYFQNKLLPKWVHNKAISKARESYRVTPAQKEALKKLKIKK